MRLLLLIIICSTSSLCNAQLKLLNRDLQKPDTNLLYISGNYFQLSDTSNENFYQITANNSDIQIINKYYFIRPKDLLDDTIKIYKDKKLLSSIIYKIRRISSIKVQVANTNDTLISTNKLLSNPLLSLRYYDNVMKMDMYLES